ncbi:MAG: hypothetical protein Q8M06_02525, partial [Methanobacteriaceae archaeon]|nr:hypothetical protein [Methanobacteriaceae archaeon]
YLGKGEKMNCENHPDKEGVAACVSCGKILCDECRLKLASKNYCQECADDLVAEKTQNSHEPIESLKKTPLEREQAPINYERTSSRGMPRPRKAEQKSNTFLLFCVAFIVTLIIAGVILYAIYLIYLAPQFGDLNNLIYVIMNNPERIFNSFGS